MIIAVDFDGTIVEHKFPAIGELLPGAKETISTLKELGHTIIIFTCRGGSELLNCKDFLDANRIPYDYLNENAPIDVIGFKPFPKVYADVYIDDKNFGGFPGWSKILNYFLVDNLIK